MVAAFEHVRLTQPDDTESLLFLLLPLLLLLILLLSLILLLLQHNNWATDLSPYGGRLG